MSHAGQVVRLPGAARRQVKQFQNKASRKAKEDLREQTAGRFPHKWPGEREAEATADRLGALQRSPELAIILAVVASMDGPQRARVMDTLNRLPSGPDADVAADLVARLILSRDI